MLYRACVSPVLHVKKWFSIDYEGLSCNHFFVSADQSKTKCRF